MLDLRTAREYAALIGHLTAEPRVVPIGSQAYDLLQGAQVLIDKLCDELNTRQRHLGRMQDMLDRLEARMRIKDDSLEDERYMTTTEIRATLTGSRQGP